MPMLLSCRVEKGVVPDFLRLYPTKGGRPILGVVVFLLLSIARSAAAQDAEIAPLASADVAQHSWGAAAAILPHAAGSLTSLAGVSAAPGLTSAVVLPALGARSTLPDPHLQSFVLSRSNVAHARVLKSMYVSLGVLEALDVHSSIRAIRAGGREANPVFANLDQWPAAVSVFKGGSFASIVFLTEKLREHHPKAAMVTMIGLNAAYSWVVANNYRAVR